MGVCVFVQIYLRRMLMLVFDVYNNDYDETIISVCFSASKPHKATHIHAWVVCAITQKKEIKRKLHTATYFHSLKLYVHLLLSVCVNTGFIVSPAHVDDVDDDKIAYILPLEKF